MAKKPSFQFYPGDWRKDPAVQALDLKHRGAWMELLCIMHESEERGVLLLNGKPTPMSAIARQLSISTEECQEVINTLLDYGVAIARPSDGAICNRRMMRDAEGQDETSKKLREAGRRGAQKRWGGNRVGHAEAIPDPKPRPCTENSSSSSSSPSGLNTENAAHSLVSDGETPPRPAKPNRAENRASPVVWDGRDGFQVCAFRRSQWAKAYPLVDLNHELDKAHAWYIDNPGRRKKHHAKFLGNWLSNAQERAKQDGRAAGKAKIHRNDQNTHIDHDELRAKFRGTA